ncbi:MAG: FAD-binding oxidoreductase, partial [Terriglobales bacterium]
ADAEQTAAVVAWARAERVPVAIGEDAGIALPMGRLAAAPAEAVRLDLGRLDRLRFYEPQDLTVGLEAGLTPAEVNARLGEQGQFLPLDAAGGEGARLGAILAAHRSGPLRQYYGTVRDFIIGIEFVTAEGKLAHGGGRVVKNVAGYDLMRLMIGARGSLGVITAANFKVFPRPGPTTTWRWPLAGWEQAEALRRAMLHGPLRPLALELAGACGAAGDLALAAYVRGAGGERARERWRRELAAMSERLGTPAPAVEDEAFWQGYGEDGGEAGEAWRLVAPAGAGVAALAGLQRAARLAGRALAWRGRLGLGVFELAARPALAERERSAWRAEVARAHPEAWLAPRGEPIEAALAEAEAAPALMRRLRDAVGETGEAARP